MHQRPRVFGVQYSGALQHREHAKRSQFLRTGPFPYCAQQHARVRTYQTLTLTPQTSTDRRRYHAEGRRMLQEAVRVQCCTL